MMQIQEMKQRVESIAISRHLPRRWDTRPINFQYLHMFPCKLCGEWAKEKFCCTEHKKAWERLNAHLKNPLPISGAKRKVGRSGPRWDKEMAQARLDMLPTEFTTKQAYLIWNVHKNTGRKALERMAVAGWIQQVEVGKWRKV
jgi:hypothetical protein